MERTITCIVCPMGCRITVGLTDDNKVEYIRGNTCKRGAEYAETECISPKRVITSTVRCSDGGVVAVKTRGAVPKELIFKCMNEINKIKKDLPIKAGDVIISNVLDTGVDIVAVQDR